MSGSLTFEQTGTGGQQYTVKLRADSPVFNGRRKCQATLYLTSAGDWLMTVRPHGDRTFDLPLGKVAEMVISRVTKNELAEKGRPARGWPARKGKR